MTDHWLCLDTVCHDHGEGDSAAEKHTKTSGHPTMTLNDPDWLARLLAADQETASDGAVSSRSGGDAP